jgi:hypothetical protein
MMLMGILIALSGCASHNVETYHSDGPKLDLKEYFNGPIKAWGIVQDRSGKVIQRFDVVMVGQWDGDTGKLEEQFDYYDGKKQTRTWIIKKINDGHYEGTAGDIIGKADGIVSGNAMRWAYQMDLDVKGNTYRITFDDWMFNMNDGVLINRSYLKKFGITMAELTLFMQKQ